MRRLIPLVLGGAVLLPAPRALAQCDGDPGFVMFSTPELGLGEELVVQATTPMNTFAMLFLSFEQGLTEFKWGPMCFDWPPAAQVPLHLNAAETLEFRCILPCEPAFNNIDMYFQFLAFNKADRKDVGISNQSHTHINDEICPETSLCPTPADPDDEYSIFGGGHAFWFPGIGTDFIFIAPGQFNEHPMSGTAKLTGLIASESDPDNMWAVDVDFTGRMAHGAEDYPPADSPKRELHDEAYAEDGGPIDTNSWHYYLTTEGTLIGMGDNEGLTMTITRKGPAFQVGFGASGKNLHMGASGWLTALLHDPFNDETTEYHGDINIDLNEECPSCPEAAESHAMWIPSIATDFLFADGAEFIQFDDGTAEMSGLLISASDPGKAFEVLVHFAGGMGPLNESYPPTDSPKKELHSSNYAENGGPIDTDTWYYYESVEGTLIGLNDFEGAILSIERAGPAFQIGMGASGKNLNFGGSGWLVGETLSQPDDGPDLPETIDRGDFNLDLNTCPPEDDPIY